MNIKKGQFLAPGDMKNVIDKARAAAREAGLDDYMFRIDHEWVWEKCEGGT